MAQPRGAGWPEWPPAVQLQPPLPPRVADPTGRMDRPQRLRALAGHLLMAAAAAPAAAAVAAAPPNSEAGEAARVLNLRQRVTEFRAHGVTSLPGLLDPVAVAALRAALQAEQAAARPAAAGAAAAAGWRAPGCFDAPGLLEGGEAGLGLLTHPRLVALLQAAVGTDAHLVNLQASQLEPGDAEAAATRRFRRGYGRVAGGAALRQA